MFLTITISLCSYENYIKRQNISTVKAKCNLQNQIHFYICNIRPINIALIYLNRFLLSRYTDCNALVVKHLFFDTNSYKFAIALHFRQKHFTLT